MLFRSASRSVACLTLCLAAHAQEPEVWLEQSAETDLKWRTTAPLLAASVAGLPIVAVDRAGRVQVNLDNVFAAPEELLGFLRENEIPVRLSNPVGPTSPVERILVGFEDAELGRSGLVELLGGDLTPRFLEESAPYAVIELGPGRALQGALISRMINQRVSVDLYFPWEGWRTPEERSGPNDPYYVSSTQEYLGQIDAPEAWSFLEREGLVIESVRAAVLDSGIAASHEDLAVKVLGAVGFAGDSALDSFGHGTHMAGVIGAQGYNGKGVIGVAWKTAGLISLKVGRTTVDPGRAVLAVRAAVELDVDVINASWVTAYPCYALRRELAAAARARGGRGIPVVCAVGNRSDALSTDNDLVPLYPASFSLPNIIAVMGVDQRGTVPYGERFGARSVHLAAPFSNIGTTGLRGYETGNGSSYSAAIVSGLASLLLSHPGTHDIPAYDLRNLLISTSIVANSPPNLVGKCQSGGIASAFFLANSDPRTFRFQTIAGSLTRAEDGTLAAEDEAGQLWQLRHERLAPNVEHATPLPGQTLAGLRLGIVLLRAGEPAILTSVRSTP